MIINRDNYEEYFLLYADNELSQPERDEVEAFVGQNADLQEEFNMIRLTVHVPDKSIALGDKSFLMKADPASFINENNCQEIFILYHDNELPLSQKAEVEGFVARHPEYITEFDLTGKARLQADPSVVFPDKKLLFRTERSGRVVPLIFWRSLAAAVVIGFGLWVGVPFFSRPKDQAPIARTEKTPTGQAAGHTLPAKPGNGIKPGTDVAVVKPAGSHRVKTGNESIKKRPESTPQQVAPGTIAAAHTGTGDGHEEKGILPDIQTGNTGIAAVVKVTPGIIDPADTELAAAGTTRHIEPGRLENNLPNPDASHASEVESDNDNYVFYDVSSEEFSKSRVGGFLKKVTRIVKRNNPITHLFGGNEEQVAAK